MQVNVLVAPKLAPVFFLKGKLHPLKLSQTLMLYTSLHTIRDAIFRAVKLLKNFPYSKTEEPKKELKAPVNKAKLSVIIEG